MKVVNLETIIDMQSWCRTWLPTGSSRIRAKQKLLRKHKVIYTDKSLEFGKACEDLSWNHCTSTPHRSETNGIAERAVRRVKEGTSAGLLQSGLDEKWWADSMEWCTYLRKVSDLLSDGKTPYQRRFGTSQESINLERKSYLDSSSDTHCTRGEFGRVTYWLQTLRSWKRWTHLKSTRKDSMQKR